MGLLRLPGFTRGVPQENNVLFPYAKSLIDQGCSVKMAGFGAPSFLGVYGSELRLGP